jgi:hypothetical protein
MNKETFDRAAEKLYPIDNTGKMFMPNRDQVNNVYKQQGFIAGAKWQVDNMPIHLYTENTYVHIEDGIIIVEKNDQTIISYSEEEVLKILHDYRNHFELHKNIQVLPDMFFPWFEKVKKK